MKDRNASPSKPITAWVLFLGAILSFHIAYVVPHGFLFGAAFIGCLVALTGEHAPRQAFNRGVALGLLAYVPHLPFFWNVFLPRDSAASGAVLGVLGVLMLWLVLPIWLGVFLCLASYSKSRFPGWLVALLIPALWTGTEYFRSELYPLKFSWLNIIYAASDFPQTWPLRTLGMYGTSYAIALAASVAIILLRFSRLAAGIFACISLAALWLPAFGLRGSPLPMSAQHMTVTGVQMEFPDESIIPSQLDELLEAHPTTDLLVLSEYTFQGPIPDEVRDWCRKNGTYLVAGGVQPLGGTNFYNTAFVVGPDGEIVFRQVKSVPIQFFRDGLPAPERRVWESPWGRLGICICYDLGYTRVTDDFIRQGAQALIVPTMDVASWGTSEHELHARVTSIRAAEHGVPIFRLASSGISQWTDHTGKVLGSAPYPGQGAVLRGILALPERGSLPLDRFLAPICVALTALLALFAGAENVVKRLRRQGPDAQPSERVSQELDTYPPISELDR